MDGWEEAREEMKEVRKSGRHEEIRRISDKKIYPISLSLYRIHFLSLYAHSLLKGKRK